MKRRDSFELGLNGEKLALDFLRGRRYEIVTKNFRVRGGEIDIVAKKGRELIFVEVKLRSAGRYGFPEENVTYRKKMRIVRALKEYIRISRISDTHTIRFDIIAILRDDQKGCFDVRHIQDVDLPEVFC